MAIHTSSRLLAPLRGRSHSSHIVPRTRYLFYFASSRGTRLGRTRPSWTNLRRTHTLGPGWTCSIWLVLQPATSHHHHPQFFLADDVCSGDPFPPVHLLPSLPCPSLVSHLTSAPQCLSNPAGKLTRKSQNNNTPLGGMEEHVMVMTMARWRSRMADHLCPSEQARTSPRARDSSCPWRARCSRRPTS